MSSTNKLFNTVKYLKLKQMNYRLFYLIRKRVRNILKFKYLMSIDKVSSELILDETILLNRAYSNNKFTFLNLSYKIENEIDWNYGKHGKLWTYNLTYFDYLNQKSISKEDGLFLINDFIRQIDTVKDGLEPFPISLRGINWIKFLVRHKIKDKKIDSSLYAQYMILVDNLEYHLLGNHLLENAFSLLFGAYYFKDEKLYAIAKKLLIAELDEQIMDDGGHFELSSMYHQIMLFRVLDCINLVDHNTWKEDVLINILHTKAEKMLGWLNVISYKNGQIPLFNDSANSITPDTQALNAYAARLSIKEQNIKLSSSGYRKFVGNKYELIVDVGNIGPDYIPGHAHSDTFNFELYVDKKPIIVDTGISTYETNKRRTQERSTNAHNTVMIDNHNQSEVWGGFRVANRAKIIELKETQNMVEAAHDGYKKFAIKHRRKFIVNSNQIIIEDIVENLGNHRAVAFLHFYPGIIPCIKNNRIFIGDVVIKCSSDDITLQEYLYAPEFNKLVPAKMVAINFEDSLKMEINI